MTAQTTILTAICLPLAGMLAIILAGRFSAEFDASDDLQFRFSYDYSDDDSARRLDPTPAERRIFSRVVALAEQRAAEQRPEYAHADVGPHPEALAAHDLGGQPAGDAADDHHRLTGYDRDHRVEQGDHEDDQHLDDDEGEDLPPPVVGVQQRVDGEQKLEDGDRVEIYRPLRVDPKALRRTRAEAQRGSGSQS